MHHFPLEKQQLRRHYDDPFFLNPTVFALFPTLIVRGLGFDGWGVGVRCEGLKDEGREG